jgi:hypothetical protein
LKKSWIAWAIWAEMPGTTFRSSMPARDAAFADPK